MDTSRIENVIDVPTLVSKQMTVVGTGASVGLVEGLTRCGAEKILLNDLDRVGAENIVRQGHHPCDIDRYKVDATREKILAINPNADVKTLTTDLTKIPEAEAESLVSGTDLFLATTDSFTAQALVNRLSLRLNVPAIFVGIYAGGWGAEVVWTDPRHQLPCFRCLCASRYAAHQLAVNRGRESLDPSSDGADIFSVSFPDAIAGQLALGLLTRGADNRYGRLMEQLGDRQFIQTSLSPEFQVNGRDPIRQRLGANNSPYYFAWNSCAMSDPDQGQLPCPDCEELRGHRFEQVDGLWQRIVPEESFFSRSDAVAHQS